MVLLIDLVMFCLLCRKTTKK